MRSIQESGAPGKKILENISIRQQEINQGKIW
jgi:hypothetical protein